MSPVEQSLIERKLLQIAERLSRLERYHADGWSQYESNFERRKTSEKLLQEVIEAAIDTNTHICTEQGGSIPADYFMSFVQVGNLGWISNDLAKKLAPSAGLRNRIVHQYAAIDDKKLFDAIKVAHELFSEYISQIRKRLSAK